MLKVSDCYIPNYSMYGLFTYIGVVWDLIPEFFSG